MRSWGHLKLRACLEQEPGGFSAQYITAPVLAQYTSVGNLDPRWLADFVESMSAGRTGGGHPLGMPAADAHLVWPTVWEVQNSLEGWFSGGSIPGQPGKVDKEFLVSQYRRWGGAVVGRQRAMPHMKSFTRFLPRGDGSAEVAWFCLSSHNLSKAAWGFETKKNGRTLLKILSYELGVLLVPSLELAYRRSRWCGFSCTEESPSTSAHIPGIDDSPCTVRFVQWTRGTPQEATLRDGVLTVPLPIPYELPPESYESGDVPWDVRGAGMPPWPGLDSLGKRFPGVGRYYGMLDQMEWGDVVGA